MPSLIVPTVSVDMNNTEEEEEEEEEEEDALQSEVRICVKEETGVLGSRP